MNFDELGLHAGLLRAVADQGYTQATPVQAKAIPVVLSGRDLMASAQTGTGKTAAFTLPILHRLRETEQPNRRAVRALILTPTRELAAQVHDNVKAYSKHLPVRSLALFGGVSINPQLDRLQRGVEVLVATPGRLIDHLDRGSVDLSQVETLVLDEADRMLDMGFRPAIERLLRALPNKRQTLLFSATFSGEIRQLANKLLQDPERVDTAPANSTVERIEQRAIQVDQTRKRELLSWMIGDQNWDQVLVFTRTKHGANRLASQLDADGLPAAAIHGNKSQGARNRALSDFKAQRVRVLVATDIAARGIDIVELPFVVNYDIPNVPEDYVHRIGRTGRAGQEGIALSLVAAAERGQFAAIRKLTGQPLPLDQVSGFEPTEQAQGARKPAPQGGGRNNRAGGQSDGKGWSGSGGRQGQGGSRTESARGGRTQGSGARGKRTGRRNAA